MFLSESHLMQDVQIIEPGDHVCLFYETEEEWENGVIPFLVTGIDRGELCICVVKNHTNQQIKKYLSETTYGITPEQIIKQLIIIRDENMTQPGHSPDMDELMNYIIATAGKASNYGFKGVRFTAEVGWIPSDLLTDFPVTILNRCYVDNFSIGTIKELVLTHTSYIRKNKVCRNFHHILPGKTKKQNRAKQLDKWFKDFEGEQENYSHVRFLANILEHSSQPFCAYLPEGKVIACNNAFCNLLGYNRSEIVQIESLEDFTPIEWQIFVDKAASKLHRTEKPQHYEKEIKCKDGRRTPVSVLVDQIKNDKGNIAYFCAFFNDITERKHSEQILQESGDKYKALFNTINEGWSLYEIIVDENNHPCNFQFSDVNPGFERQTGLSKENIIGHTMTEAIPDFDMEWLAILIQAALDGEQVSFQKYSPSFDKYFETSIFCATNKHLSVMTIDITKQKHLEEELQEQVYFLQHLIDNIPNPVFYKNLDGIYQGCNTAYSNIMGLPRNEIIGRTFLDIALHEIAEDGWKMDQQLFASGDVQHYDGILPYADGSLHDVIYNKAPVFSMNQKLTGLVGVTVDITERKQAEHALAISEEKFRNIFSQSPIGISIINCNGILVDANPACLEIFGINAMEDLAGFKLFEDPNLPDEIKQKLINGEVVRYEGEFNFNIVRQQKIYNTNKSEYAYFNYLITPLTSHAGSAGFLVQVQDVTEQQKSAIALKNSETQLRRITGTMRDIISQTDISGIVQYISPSFKSVLGYEPEDMIGQSFWSFTHPDDMCRIMEENRLALSKGSYDKIEFRYQHQNGHYIWLEAVGNPLWDEHGTMVGIVFGTRDITERKHIEKEMARLDRLRLAGEMAATIGHEIRNPMTTVHGFLQMLKSEPECRSFQSYFDLMIEELNAANSIITEFLSLAQDKAIYLKVQNLNSLVKNIYPLIAAEAIKSDKKVTLKLRDIAQAGIDSNEIRQLILNLALNGLEAMESGGILQISTYMNKGQIILAVKDQGKGIDPSVFDKLGTPFVTTKENGTGLGLAVCYSIANRHNAVIDYKTSPKGTTFLTKFNPALTVDNRVLLPSEDTLTVTFK